MGQILSRTETLMAKALDLFHVLLKRLCKCRHNDHDSTTSKPNLQGQGHKKRTKLCPPSKKLPVAEISVATTFNAHPVFYRAESSKVVTASAGEAGMAIFTSARSRTSNGHLKHSTESENSYRTKLSALMPFVKAEPGTHKSAAPPGDTVLRGHVRRSRSARTSRRVEGAATKESSFDTLTPRLKYQKHIEELEKRRMILQSLKREYSRAKADYERSENTLQCLRRQGQDTLHFWRKQKHSTEGSLRKMARRLRNGRLLEKEMMMKVWKEPQRYDPG